MRAIFQAGLRPAVARLYDPFDAMLARQGGGEAARRTSRASARRRRGARAGRALRARPAPAGRAERARRARAGRASLGGALLVAIFEGTGDAPGARLERARARIVEAAGGDVRRRRRRRDAGSQHRYSVSYRQAPVFATGAFVDTMEVAATLVEPRRALRRRAPRARRARVRDGALQPRVPRRVLHLLLVRRERGARPRRRGRAGTRRARRPTTAPGGRRSTAAIAAGGTLAHHHGVGRSKAPRLGAELGAGVDVVRALQRAFDPHGILNPGNLDPAARSAAVRRRRAPARGAS